MTVQSRTQAGDRGQSVASIEVDELFGRYTYRIDSQEPSPLLLLYGDNGCGKTTILRLVYNILSPADGRGHRSFVARVPFRRFQVTLADGTQICAKRPSEILGSYHLSIDTPDSQPVTCFVKSDDGRVRSDENPGLDRFIGALRSHNLSLFFLGDDRILQGEGVDQEYRTRAIRTSAGVFEYIRDAPASVQRRQMGRRDREDYSRELALAESMKRAERWLREQRQRDLDRGEFNTNAIYLSVAEALTKPWPASSALADINALADRLVDLNARNQHFERFGLMPESDLSGLIALLRNAPRESHKVLHNVLSPYATGFEARLDAQQPTLDVLEKFEKNINSLLTDKQAFLHSRYGLAIITSDPTSSEPKPHVLPPEKLSSGEKQLLLLMCNALAARESASIFIIDEPELSLNVKWQRTLIRGLLEITQGSEGQFLMASHSIELFAKHRATVVRLANRTA